MKSKNLTFLLLVGLIAPSAVMSAESSKTVTPGHEIGKKRTLQEKIQTLQEKIQTLKEKIQSITECEENNTNYQPQGVGNISSKNLVCSLNILLQLSDHIADGNPSKSQKSGTVIEKFFKTYATFAPDSWCDDLIQLRNAPLIENYLKLQDIQNAVNKISKGIGSTIIQSSENTDFNILIDDMKSSINVLTNEIIPCKKLVQKYSQLQEFHPNLYKYSQPQKFDPKYDRDDKTFDQDTYEMSKKLRGYLNQLEYDKNCGDRLETTEIKETEECNELIKKEHGFKVLLKSISIYLEKIDKITTQRENIINYFVSLRDANPKELALTQKNILNRIEIILDYIENSRTKDRK